MASEGVLSFGEKRYGFGHESFFDYCFARGFVAKEESLTAFLVKLEATSVPTGTGEASSCLSS